MPNLQLGNLLTAGNALLAFPNKYSFNFDGSNDYLAGSDLGLPSSNNARSVSFWINADSVTTYGMMFSYGTSSSNSAFAISWDNANAKIIVGKYAGNANSGSSSTISTGSWNHIVVTFDGLSTIKYYLNGSADGTATLSGINTVVNEFRIGGYLNGWSGANFFDGKIDEVAVWNVELSADDVAKIASKPVDFSKASTYATDRTSNLKLWLRAGDKAEPESTTAIARQDFYTDFDGTDDYIKVDANSSINSLFATGGTFSAWVNVGSAGEDSNGRVAEKGFLILTTIPSGSTCKLSFYVPFSTTAGSWLTNNHDINFNEWQHIAITYDGSSTSNNASIYINGISVAVTETSTPVGSISDDTADLYIGNRSATDRSFNGSISNLALHQTILDAQTISQMTKSRFTPVRNSRFSVVDFDGSNDYISTNVNSTLTDGTYTFWAKATETGRNRGTFGHGGLKKGGFSFNYDDTRPFLRFGSGIYRYWNDNSAQDDGAWHHWAVIIDSDDITGCKLYVDGIEQTVAETLNSGSADAYTTGLEIGRADSSNEWEGSMAQFAVYSDLKDSEFIYAQWSKGITADYSNDTNLSAYYKMGDDTSKAYPTIADSSSNSNDGTITNGASDDIVQQMVAGYDMGAFEGSEELGAELLGDGQFSDDVSQGSQNDNWNVVTAGTVTHEISNGRYRYTNSGTATLRAKKNNSLIALELNKLHKLTFEIFDNNALMSFSTNAETLIGNVTYPVGTHTVYFTPTASHFAFDIKPSSSSQSFSMDNVSVKEVLQSEVSDTYPLLVDVNNPVISQDLQTGTWNNNDPSSNGMQGFTGASADGFTAINADSGQGDNDASYGDEISFTAGKTYKLSFTNTINSGTMPSLFVGVTSGTAGSADNIMSYATISSTGDYSYNFTPSSTVTRRPSFRFVANGAYDFTISNFELIEYKGNTGVMTNQASDDLVYSSVLPDQSFLTGANSSYGFGSFDGTNDIVTASAVNTDYKSVSLWVRPSTTITPASSGSALMFFGNWTFGSVRLGSATGDFTNELITITDNYGVVTKTAWIPSGGETIPNDSWTHLAFVWDGSKYVIYYNGQPQTVVTVSNGHAPLNTNKDIRIGTGGTSSTSFFGGDITGVAFWNKSLTDAQILSIYNNGRHSNLYTDFSDNLITYLAFGNSDATSGFEDTSSTIYDRSGKSNHGTVSGTTLQSPPNAEPNGYAKGDTNRSTTTP